jgi:regulator of replication initiation timing
MFLINNADGRIRELMKEIKALKKQLKEAVEANEQLLKNKIPLL